MSDIAIIAVIGIGGYMAFTGTLGEVTGGVGDLVGNTTGALGGIIGASGGLLTSGITGVGNLGHELFDKGGAIDRTSADVKNTTAGLFRFVGAGGIGKTGDKVAAGIKSIKIPKIPKPKIRLPKLRLFK